MELQQGTASDNSHAAQLLPSLLWKEIVSYRTHFKAALCAEILLLKLLPSLNDIVSDFLVASWYSLSQDVLVNTWVTFYSYSAICLPGIFLAFSFLHFGLKTRPCLASVALLVTMVLLVSLSFLPSWPTGLHPQLMFLPAVGVSVLLLTVKTLAVFIHGPNVQRLARLVSPYEGRFECVNQLIITMAMLMSGRVGVGQWTPFYSLTTSFLILSRDVAEQLLSSGEDLLAGRPLWERLVAIRRLLPAILTTAIFRIGSSALIYYSVLMNELPPVWVWFLVIYAPPFILIILLKRCVASVKDLSCFDILRGIFEETSAFTVWGNLGREGSRLPQLVLHLHFLLVFGSYCTWKAVVPPTLPAGDLRLWAVLLLVAGLVSLVLFLQDIYYMSVGMSDLEDAEAGAGELVRGTALERCGHM